MRSGAAETPRPADLRRLRSSPGTHGGSIRPTARSDVIVIASGVHAGTSGPEARGFAYRRAVVPSSFNSGHSRPRRTGVIRSGSADASSGDLEDKTPTNGINNGRSGHRVLRSTRSRVEPARCQAVSSISATARSLACRYFSAVTLSYGLAGSCIAVSLELLVDQAASRANPNDIVERPHGSSSKLERDQPPMAACHVLGRIVLHVRSTRT